MQFNSNPRGLIAGAAQMGNFQASTLDLVALALASVAAGSALAVSLGTALLWRPPMISARQIQTF